MLFQKGNTLRLGIKRMIDGKNKMQKCSLKNGILSSPMDSSQKNPPEKVSLYALLKEKCRKGSLALETAIVLPLFLLGLVTIISFMDIYRLQTVHLQELCEKAKTVGMYAYRTDGTGTDEITLPDVYSYTPVSGLIPLPKLWMHNTVKVHAWTGVDTSAFTGSSCEAETMVYVTETGSVYHKKAGCRYLNISVNQVSGTEIAHLRNDSGAKYSPCETCSKNQNPAGTVYITSSGNRYHNVASCSGLKRSVKLVKQSDVSGMHACSKCG